MFETNGTNKIEKDYFLNNVLRLLLNALTSGIEKAPVRKMIKSKTFIPWSCDCRNISNYI